MTTRQADLFDRLASGDALYEYADDALAAMNALVPEKGRVLDVGCGDGAMGAALDASYVAAFDVSPRCAVLARKRGPAALVADAAAGFPFAPGSFDTVYCMDVLHHLHGAWEAVLAEADRVLKPGGALVLVEPDAANPFVRWTQAPRSPIRVAPYANEPALYAGALAALLDARGYVYDVRPIHIEGRQVVRSVFPLWQRALKAPFVAALAWWCRNRPNKFAIIARKPGGSR